ncbi:MAG TPA: hypothetical protein VJ912_03565 [Candidatus Nanoarchaeia archaeon]|nr:hypothetical protein [Candidatus Nanoarchaeia archaeon]
MDYKEKQKIRKIFAKKGMPEGACFGSKTGYKERNHGNKVIFNALIYFKEPYYDLLKQEKINPDDFFDNGKYSLLEDYEVWQGDLDLTKNKKNLEKIAGKIKEDLVVTNEHTEKQEDISQRKNIFQKIFHPLIKKKEYY